MSPLNASTASGRNTPNIPNYQQSSQQPPVSPTTQPTGQPENISFNFDNDDGGNFDYSIDDAPQHSAMEGQQNPPRLFQFTKNGEKKRHKAAMDEIQKGDPWEEVDLDDDDAAQAGLKKITKKRRRQRRQFHCPDLVQDETTGMQLPSQSIADYFDENIYSGPRPMPKANWKKPSTPALYGLFCWERKNRLRIATQLKKKHSNDYENEQPNNQQEDPAQIEREQEEREANISRNLHLIFDAPDDDDHDDHNFGGVDDGPDDDPMDDVDEAGDDGKCCNFFLLRVVSCCSSNNHLEMYLLCHHPRHHHIQYQGQQSKLASPRPFRLRNAYHPRQPLLQRVIRLPLTDPR